MPRPAKLLLPKSYYHIMTRGNNKNIIFRKDEDYKYFIKLLKKYKLELPFNLYHYCLMPNHVHMLIQTKNAKDFAIFMKKINLAYFYHYKQSYGWVGHFWQDRYKSQPVGKDMYFIQCGKYIELNPVRKGLVKLPSDWRYSSYKFYSLGEKNNLISEDILYKDLGNNDYSRRDNYEKTIVDEIVTKNYPNPVWGSRRQRYNERNKRQKYFSRHKKYR